MSKPEWEAVTDTDRDGPYTQPYTYRLRVPWGWIYRVNPYDPGTAPYAICFVPDNGEFRDGED